MVNKRTFFRERVIFTPLLATRHDRDLRALVVTGTVALGQITPWVDRMTTFTRLAFATTVRVIDRVHDHAADGRANTHPTLGHQPCPIGAGCVLRWRPRQWWPGSRCGSCGLRQSAYAPGHKVPSRPAACAEAPAVPDQLGATANLQLHAVDDGAHGDVAEWAACCQRGWEPLNRWTMLAPTSKPRGNDVPLTIGTSTPERCAKRSDRTQCARPWRERHPCRASGSPPHGNGACDHPPRDGVVMWPLLFLTACWNWGSSKAA